MGPKRLTGVEISRHLDRAKVEAGEFIPGTLLNNVALWVTEDEFDEALAKAKDKLEKNYKKRLSITHDAFHEAATNYHEVVARKYEIKEIDEDERHNSAGRKRETVDHG